MSDLAKNKVSSLRWAIDELSKQKEDLAAQLKVAKKREETNSLIEEVFAQKDALEKRISALQDGLKVSTELVDAPLGDLESELEKVNEKLDIAQERLDNIEQEEYLEELGKKLNRSHSPNDSGAADEETNDSLATDPSFETEKPEDFSESPSDIPHFSNPSENPTQPSPAPLLQTMKAKTNRITETESEEPKVQTQHSPATQAVSSSLPISLEDTAASLGVDSNFLAEKGIQAILRMISRNGGKLTFPLEVEQID